MKDLKSIERDGIKTGKAYLIENERGGDVFQDIEWEKGKALYTAYNADSTRDDEHISVTEITAICVDNGTPERLGYGDAYEMIADLAGVDETRVAMSDGIYYLDIYECPDYCETVAYFSVTALRHVRWMRSELEYAEQTFNYLGNKKAEMMCLEAETVELNSGEAIRAMIKDVPTIAAELRKVDEESTADTLEMLASDIEREFYIK